MPINDSLVLTEKITEDQIKKDLLSQQDYQIQDRKDYQYLQLGKKLNEYNVRRLNFLHCLRRLSMPGTAKSQTETSLTCFKKETGSPVRMWSQDKRAYFSLVCRMMRISKSSATLKQTENEIDNLKIAIDNEIAVVAKKQF